MNGPDATVSPPTDAQRVTLHERIAATVAIAYAATACADLIAAWQRSPFDRLGWLALAIWLLPLALRMRDGALSVGWLAFGLLVSTFGRMGDLNAAQHVGLAWCLVAIVPRGRGRWLWLATSISWMPLLGWVGCRGLAGYEVAALRVLLAVFGATALWRSRAGRDVTRAMDATGATVQ